MNKLKIKIESVGLNFKTQVIFAISIALVGFVIGFVLFYILKNIICLAFSILLTVMVDYIFLTRYKNIEVKNESNVNNEFISLLSFFKTYISNGYSVYQSFKELVPFSSSILQDRLNIFLDAIDNDKSVTPFINFASKFKNPKIEQLLISIYQMVDEGNNLLHLSQFEMLFSRLREESYKNKVHEKEKSLSSMSAFPLIGSGLLIVMITFGIIQIIGEMANGI